jgi:hypothetical protein
MGRSNSRSEDSPPDSKWHSAPISLTIRDQNIIRAPRRTSSLRSPSITGLLDSNPPKPSHFLSKKAENTNQSKKSSHTLPLQVSKTRRQSVQEENSSRKDGRSEIRQVANFSIKPNTPIELHESISRNYEIVCPQVRECDAVSSKHDVQKNTTSRPVMTASSETELQTSQPSTSTSYIASDTGENQRPQRRHSVRRAVTNAFANLNIKRRTNLAFQHDSLGHLARSRFSSQSDTSICSSFSKDAAVPLGNSAISMVGKTWNDYSPPNLSLPHIATTMDDTPRLRGHKVTLNHQHSENLCVEPPSLLPEENVAPPPLAKRFNTGSTMESSLFPLTCRDNPLPSAVLRVRLAVKPEFKEVELFSEEMVWATVQIHGEMAYQTAPQTSALPSLALAVVLDNS